MEFRHDPYAVATVAGPVECTWDGRSYGRVRVPQGGWPQVHGANTVASAFDNYESVCLEHWRQNVPPPNFSSVLNLLLLMAGKPRLTPEEQLQYREYSGHPMWDTKYRRWKAQWNNEN